MKTLVIFFSLIFLGIASKAQNEIPLKKVPIKVQESFKKKASKSKEIVWHLVKKDYWVTYSYAGNPEQMWFTSEGVILKTKVKLDPENLPKMVANAVERDYEKLNVMEAYLMTEGRKDKYFSLYMTKNNKTLVKEEEQDENATSEEEGDEQESNKKEKKAKRGEKVYAYEKDPHAFEVQYTAQGNLITSYEKAVPEEVDVKEANYIVVDADEVADVDIYGENVRSKDLPSKIQDYMKKNFTIEYKYNTCKVMKDEKFGEHYYIVMKKQGEKTEFVHYFDINGNLLKSEER